MSKTASSPHALPHNSSWWVSTDVDSCAGTHKLMYIAANVVVSSVSDSQINSPAALPAMREAQSMGGFAKKGSASRTFFHT
jgi:hypothetical protein